ncbi:hypothetical protein [Weissella confusa]|uniref:hypothetical protein n=1 Tax=Weissella confusa TaxID=1583 RepID=UPI0018F11EB7|nr:hypothetical protein [Weissella confusa]MBJ7697033.1 hypothetical protein [Weissella confusa]
MTNIADLQAFVIGVVSNDDNNILNAIVESETDASNLIFNLIILGFSQNKNEDDLKKLFDLLENNLDESDETLISNVSELIENIFK